MNKEEAIKILRTDISGRMRKKWLLLQLPFILFLVALIIIHFAFPDFKLEKGFLGLPQPTVTKEQVIFPLFTGSITFASILIGFFGVSAYNFRRDFQECRNDFQEEMCRETAKVRKDKDYLDYLRVNFHASGHLVEHLGKFVVTFFAVVSLHLFVYLLLYSFMISSSIFIDWQGAYSSVLLFATFSGLAILFAEFMPFPEHEHL